MDTLPLSATDNGDGTATLKVDTELTATIDPTGLATSSKQDTGNSSLNSIDGKLPTLVGGKIPVDASVSIDSIDIGDVDIKEFPAGNLGQQAKAASLSVAPATDITDATYIGDIKFGESLPSGTALLGKVSIDQVTANANEVVVKTSALPSGAATSAKQDTLANVFGPTAPTPVAISFASADAQTIIAAPAAGYRIRITSLFLSAGTDVTVAMKSASTTIGTIYGMAFAKDWVQPLKLGTAEAFILDATSADQIYGQVCYYVESV